MGVKSNFQLFFRKNFSLGIVPRAIGRKNPYIIGDTEGREGRGICTPIPFRNIQHPYPSLCFPE